MEYNPDLAQQCLSKLSPSRAVAYDDWLNVGMALFHSGCDCSVWSSWYPDGKPNHEEVCRGKWESFKNFTGHARSLRSLIRWAEEDSGSVFSNPAGSASGTLLPLTHQFTAHTGPDVWNPDADLVRYIQSVFRPGDVFNIVATASKNKQGKWAPSGLGNYTLEYESFIDNLNEGGAIHAIGDTYVPEAGVWVRHNPLDGNGVANKNVVDLRHVLVESDDIPVDQQLAIIERLNLPCSAVLHSGNKSIHAIVKIDAGQNAELYRARVKFLYDTLRKHGFNVDTQCKNAARLSRLPGFTRGDRRQYLIHTNFGCASWGEWIDHIEDQQRNTLSIESLLTVNVEKEDDSLILPRFVCKEASWMIVSQSGVGKSSLMMQMAISFACGIPIFELMPAKPLRSLIIQAENNRLDLVEPIQGIVSGLQLTKQQTRQANDNVVILTVDTLSGDRFCSWLDRAASAYAPLDLVWIDPLLAYAGCDISHQADASKFFRNLLNPVIHKHKFACCVIHHTPKVRKKSQDDDYDLSYIGAGSAELTNWARAVSIIEKTGDNPITANFQHVKRHSRLSCKSIDIAHATDGSIFWTTLRQSYPEELQIAEKISRAMPPHKLTKDQTTNTESLHKWCQDHLNLPTHQEAYRFAERMRKRADRLEKKKLRNEPVDHLEPSVWERVSINGQTFYQGINYVKF